MRRLEAEQTAHRRLQWIITRCLRKKPHRRFASMLEVETRLGKLLAGSTTKAASLQRIADSFVSRKVFEAAPDQETMVIPPKPRLWGWGRLAAAADLVNWSF